MTHHNTKWSANSHSANCGDSIGEWVSFLSYFSAELSFFESSILLCVQTGHYLVVKTRYESQCLWTYSHKMCNNTNNISEFQTNNSWWWSICFVVINIIFVDFELFNLAGYWSDTLSHFLSEWKYVSLSSDDSGHSPWGQWQKITWFMYDV